jgi:hypothetical protein
MDSSTVEVQTQQLEQPDRPLSVQQSTPSAPTATGPHQPEIHLTIAESARTRRKTENRYVGKLWMAYRGLSLKENQVTHNQPKLDTMGRRQFEKMWISLSKEEKTKCMKLWKTMVEAE